MHNAAFRQLAIDAAYVALPVEPAQLPNVVQTLRHIGCFGASVTVPHKSAVMALCDQLSPAAKAIGAVNTLEFRNDGVLCGHNTDAPGFVRAFVEATQVSMRDRKIVLLGGGGAARAVAVGVQEAGAASLKVIARSPQKVSWAQAHAWTDKVLATHLQDCDTLIDCTSMGLDAQSESELPAAIPLEQLPKDSIVSTLVYHRETQLLSQARGLGLKTVDGAGMLLFQGAIALELWTGRDAPIDVMRAALRDS